MNNVRTSARNSSQYLTCLKSKTSLDILSIEKCIVTFGFKYIKKL